MALITKLTKQHLVLFIRDIVDRKKTVEKNVMYNVY